MLQGLRTAIYHVDDIGKAKEWYGVVLGFDVGGFELGLQPDASETPRSDTGVSTYWGVDDAEAALLRLLELGATERAAVQNVGDGIRLATVFDPFGNVFGVIENPHFSIE